MVVAILSICIATISIGIVSFRLSNATNISVEPDLVLESDSETQYSEQIFEELDYIHIPKNDYLLKYVTHLRLHMAELETFDDLLVVLQYMLENYGISQPDKELGMYSSYDLGYNSKIRLITQRNYLDNDSVVIVVDLTGDAPWTSSLIYRGDLDYVLVDSLSRAWVIYSKDGSKIVIDWEGI